MKIFSNEQKYDYYMCEGIFQNWKEQFLCIL